MIVLQKLILPGSLYLLTLVFGFWLSRAGKPYNNLLFTIHKLIALGAVVLVVIRFWRMTGPVDSLALLVGLLVVAALCVIALFASGALMSAGKLDYALMLTIHRVAPVLLTIALGLVIYLLGKKGVP